jgi:elongator complex protein 3
MTDNSNSNLELQTQAWKKARQYTPEILASARKVLEDLRSGGKLSAALRRHPIPGGGYLGKHVLVAAYRQLTESGEWAADEEFLARIRMKPVRTLSGVTTVTVLTMPYPCPGKCVF